MNHIKLILSVFLVLFFSCKKKSGFPEKKSIAQKSIYSGLEDAQTLDSLQKWQDLILGSELILKNFPDSWSYPSIISDDYDSSVTNEFNDYLTIAEEAYDISKDSTIEKSQLLKLSQSEVTVDAKMDLPNVKNEINLTNGNLVGIYNLNENYFIALYQEIKNQLSSNEYKRMDLITFDKQFEIKDKLNIYIKGNGDQHAYMKFFYIEKGILKSRIFYVYDGESLSQEIKTFQISKDGVIIEF